MKKISLLSIFEGFFHPEVPGPRNSHSFNSPRSMGDAIDKQAGIPDTLSDQEIDQELNLEFKTMSVMRDPLNLPGHNVHNGGYGPGKGSKPFGNYQTKSKQVPDESQEDVMLRTIEQDNPQGLSILSDPEIASALGLPREKEKPYREKVRGAKNHGQEAHWKDAKSQPRQSIDEDVGMREKGRAYGSPITTKQPFASGMPKITDSNFFSEEEIESELGLREWMSSTPIFNKHAKSDKHELNFFENNRPNFTMNTEEEFNQNQKKVKNEKKKRTKAR